MKNLSRPAFLQRFALLLALFTYAPFSPHSALAQSSKADKKPVDGNTVLAKVGTENITYKTLEEAFRKNLNNKNIVLSALPADSVRDFLNLYVNYRLKVLDARTRGIDQKPDIIEDIKQNRASLAVPYLFEKMLVAKRVDTAMARRKMQFKVGLILSKINGADTTQAFKRSQAMLEALKKGANFTKMAKDSSDDEYFRAQGGEMPMVTSDRIVRDIENAAFSMNIGEIYSKIIRSNLSTPGYYIVKLLAMEPRIAVRGRYIVIKPDEQKDSTKAFDVAKKLTDSVYSLVKKGEDFATLAKKFSQDAYAESGGLFPNYYTQTTGYVNGLRARFPDVVEAWLFDTKRKNGDISEPISNATGNYIVRRDSSQIGGDEREDMKRFYKRVHFEADKKTFFDSVKAVRKFVLAQKTFDAFLKAVDTTRPAFDSAQKLKLSAKLKKETLASFTDGKANGKLDYKLSISSFADSLLLRPDVRGFSLNKQGMTQALDKIIEAALTDALTRNMEKDMPDFAALMKEFQEGILIFRVEEQEVWSKMKFDTVKARVWHEGQKDKYKTIELYDFSEIWVKSDSLAQVLYKRIQANMQAAKPSATLFDSLAMQFTERTGFKERKGRWDLLDAREFTIPGEFKKRGSKSGDILAPFKFQGNISIPRMNALLPPRVKTFEEAIPDFAAQFQDLQQRELTQKWLDSLRAKHTVVIEQETIKSIWK